jgi:hypothetical protein
MKALEDLYEALRTCLGATALAVARTNGFAP